VRSVRRTFWDVLDSVLLVLLTALAIALLVLQWKSDMFGAIVSFLFALIPPALLHIRTVVSMLVLAFMTLPCCFGAYTLCDITNGPVIAILHPLHAWLSALTIYALLRALIMAWQRSRKGSALGE